MGQSSRGPSSATGRDALGRAASGAGSGEVQVTWAVQHPICRVRGIAQRHSNRFRWGIRVPAERVLARWCLHSHSPIIVRAGCTAGAERPPRCRQGHRQNENVKEGHAEPVKGFGRGCALVPGDLAGERVNASPTTGQLLKCLLKLSSRRRHRRFIWEDAWDQWARNGGSSESGKAHAVASAAARTDGSRRTRQDMSCGH